jgi:hemerythrin-like domain-containing protein
MKPTEILMNEHRVIEQVLTCLERMIEEAKTVGALQRQPALDTIDFIRNFADKCHHAKEEVQLFGMMEKRGVPVENGPIGVMLQEHQYGRDCVKEMAVSLDSASRGDENAMKTFGKYAQAFISMLREHINKEDRILYSIADEVLTAEDQRELLLRFNKTEHEDIGEGVHQKYLDIAAALGDRYQVSLPENQSASGCFACGHRCG